ncbi:MAG: hypothetical protein ACR9NN_01265 [Nostochopsis sp.]
MRCSQQKSDVYNGLRLRTSVNKRRSPSLHPQSDRSSPHKKAITLQFPIIKAITHLSSSKRSLEVKK